MDRLEHPIARDGEPRAHPTAELKGCRLRRYVSVRGRGVLRGGSARDFS